MTLWIENWKRNLETLEIKLKILTDTQTVENQKIFEKLETNIQHLKVSIHKYTLNMDTRCGIRKTIELWIYLEKLKNQKDGIILLESNTPAFESVQLQV